MVMAMYVDVAASSSFNLCYMRCNSGSFSKIRKLETAMPSFWVKRSDILDETNSLDGHAFCKAKHKWTLTDSVQMKKNALQQSSDVVSSNMTKTTRWNIFNCGQKFTCTCKERVHCGSHHVQWFLQLSFICDGMSGTQTPLSEKTFMWIAPNLDLF